MEVSFFGGDLAKKKNDRVSGVAGVGHRDVRSKLKPFFPHGDAAVAFFPPSFPLRNAVMKRLPFGRDGWMLLGFLLWCYCCCCC